MDEENIILDDELVIIDEVGEESEHEEKSLELIEMDVADSSSEDFDAVEIIELTDHQECEGTEGHQQCSSAALGRDRPTQMQQGRDVPNPKVPVDSCRDQEWAAHGNKATERTPADIVAAPSGPEADMFPSSSGTEQPHPFLMDMGRYLGAVLARSTFIYFSPNRSRKMQTAMVRFQREEDAHRAVELLNGFYEPVSMSKICVAYLPAFFPHPSTPTPVKAEAVPFFWPVHPYRRAQLCQLSKKIKPFDDEVSPFAPRISFAVSRRGETHSPMTVEQVEHWTSIHNSSIFVTNIPTEANEEDICTWFAQFGPMWLLELFPGPELAWNWVRVHFFGKRSAAAAIVGAGREWMEERVACEWWEPGRQAKAYQARAKKARNKWLKRIMDRRPFEGQLAPSRANSVETEQVHQTPAAGRAEGELSPSEDGCGEERPMSISPSPQCASRSRQSSPKPLSAVSEHVFAPESLQQPPPPVPLSIPPVPSPPPPDPESLTPVPQSDAKEAEPQSDSNSPRPISAPGTLSSAKNQHSDEGRLSRVPTSSKAGERGGKEKGELDGRPKGPSKRGAADSPSCRGSKLLRRGDDKGALYLPKTNRFVPSLPQLSSSSQLRTLGHICSVRRGDGQQTSPAAKLAEELRGTKMKSLDRMRKVLEMVERL